VKNNEHVLELHIRQARTDLGRHPVFKLQGPGEAGLKKDDKSDQLLVYRLLTISVDADYFRSVAAHLVPNDLEVADRTDFGEPEARKLFTQVLPSCLSKTKISCTVSHSRCGHPGHVRRGMYTAHSRNYMTPMRKFFRLKAFYHFGSKFDAMIVIFVIALFLFSGCESKRAPDTTAPAISSNRLELMFAYGSEKEKWITDVTDAFNLSDHRTSQGERIYVRAIPMGSGEAINETLDGRRQPHIISPASSAFIEIGNARSRSMYGNDLVGTTQSLVRSPVVIAMWKPMAESLGWGKNPIGWSDIAKVVRNPKGWAAYGHPEWGKFKFGHTRPPYSTSGLNSLIMEVYAASGRTSNVTLADVNSPRTTDFLANIEKSIVYYGSSTGFYGRLMFSGDPQSLSAAVLYENMVIESFSGAKRPFPIVAIYPKEGTFWSDHPVGIVERSWVTPEHREAAKIYIGYLLERSQQEKAIAFGFRPGDMNVPLNSPIDAAHGVNPSEPKITLELPSEPVVEKILGRWGRQETDTEKHKDR
jgi:Ca-activated chloride channel family protein